MWSVVWFLAHVYRENSVERGEPTLYAINQHESFQCILSPLKHFLRTSHEVPHPKSVTTYKSSTFKSEVLMDCAIKKCSLLIYKQCKSSLEFMAVISFKKVVFCLDCILFQIFLRSIWHFKISSDIWWFLQFQGVLSYFESYYF
jgi:hypothetical protein